jgi:endo-1,4-beta-xylanase
VTVVGQWPGGFQGEVRVTNLATTQRESWTVTFVLPAGQQVAQGWSGQFSQAGSTVTVRNAAWNGTLAPGGSTVAGFLASWSGTNTPATAVTCS